tara:strand:+ start:1188 stop:1427 length:240 start_codon:yes stop_codon:yes gene_type:complete
VEILQVFMQIFEKEMTNFLNIFSKFMIVGLLIWLCVELETTIKQNQDANWCSEEISTMRNQLSDLWFYNQLDKVDIISE